MQLRARLEKDQAVALWRDLAAHARRDRVFVLRGALPLVAVGEALVGNDARTVESWLTNGQLSRPTPDEISAWDAAPGLFFDMLIVEPWVLIRPSKLAPVSEPAEAQTSLEELASFAAARLEED